MKKCSQSIIPVLFMKHLNESLIKLNGNPESDYSPQKAVCTPATS